MTVEDAGRALDSWGVRIDAARRRGGASRQLDRLAATHDNLERHRRAVHASTPALALERFLLRTSKFVDEATRFFDGDDASRSAADVRPER